MIVPSDIGTDLIETKLGRGIIAVSSIFGPGLGQVARRAAAVRVDGISQMQKEIRMLRPNRVHHRKGFIAFSRIPAAAKRHLRKIVRSRRSDKAGNVSGLLTVHGGAVVIGFRRLKIFESNEYSTVGLSVHGERTDGGKVTKARLLAVVQNHLATRFGGQPDHA